MEDRDNNSDKPVDKQDNARKTMIVVMVLLAIISITLKVYSCKQRNNRHIQLSGMNQQHQILQQAAYENLLSHCQNPVDAPSRKDVTWKNPHDSLSLLEKTFMGTLTTTVGDLSLKTGGVMISLGDTAMATANSKVVKMLDDIKKSKHLKSECIWLELYDDHTGFWNACMLNNNIPTALDNIDPYTGKHQGFGVKFDWKIDKNAVHIQFEDCLKYPLIVGDSSVVTVKVKYWDLLITKTKRNSQGLQVLTVTDFLPEYEFTSPVSYEYELVNATLGEKITKYKSAIIE